MGLLHRSMTGAVLILAVFLLRALALRRLPKVTFWVLWMVAAVRLLFPFSIPSRLSLYNLFPFSAPSRLSLYKLVAKAVQDGTLEHDIAGSVQLDGMAWWAVQKGDFLRSTALKTVYFAGCALLGAYFLASYFSWWKKFRVALPTQHTGVGQWAGKQKRAGLFVRVLDQIKSPLTYGIFRPVILLPKAMDWEDGETLTYILDHEYAHIRHGDALAKVIFAVALCMHWFNPAVWVMYFLANRDMELYCDETVVRMGGQGAREKYALALLRMEEWKKQPFSMYSHFSGNALKERIVAIMKIRKKSVLGVVFAVGLVAGTTMLFATSAFAGDAKKEEGSKGGSGTVMISATPTPAPGEEVPPERIGGETPENDTGSFDQKWDEAWDKMVNGEASMVFVDENGNPDESGEHQYVKIVDQDGNVLLFARYTSMGDGIAEIGEVPADHNAEEDHFVDKPDGAGKSDENHPKTQEKETVTENGQ